MKQIVVLDGKTLGKVDYIKLNELGQVIYYDMTKKKDIKSRIKDADIILVNKVILDAEELQSAKNLKLICEMATGYNNIDIDYCIENNIAVTNVAGYSTSAVVQHTFALFFALNNRIEYFDDFVKSGEYSKSKMFTNLDKPFNDLNGKVWGIIGLGAIGKNVARIAQAFGARVIYYSTSGKNDNTDYARVNFDDLLEKSDVISIHAPLNKKTEGLINYKAFKKMKKSCILINVGRGPIVVEQDLARALDKDLIFGAGVDVFCREPLLKSNPLLKINDPEKIIMTPHVAWTSKDARDRLFNGVLENIRAFIAGEKRNRVD
ncbi:D-2-hydroxyacid dehydrogenase [Clostridium sp. BJN0001]|uniref:D-2-hydroxyacid dehydrogenase n=1 Tax=Clostridium sp. BJN0001 TaxID=2930219 RepID=UPI001FD3691B|nr:D-2-hydroxyacid dehydrogenase [Clostridium sp. BJN0001]